MGDISTEQEKTMTTQTNQEQTTEKPDLIDMVDKVGLITERAKGVLELISLNLDSDNKASNEVVKSSVHAVIGEIEQIEDAVHGYHKSSQATEAPAKEGEKDDKQEEKEYQPTKPQLDDIYASAQRAHAVVSMTISGFNDATLDDIFYSLYSIQKEINETKEALDALLSERSV